MRVPWVRVFTGAVVVGLVTGAAVSPARAAGEVSATVGYTCTTPFGDARPAARYLISQPPSTMVAGQSVRLGATATFALDAATTHLAQAAFGWTSFDGTITTTPSGSRAGLDLAIAKTVLGNGPSGTTNAPMSGAVVIRPTSAGAYTLRLGRLGTAVLHGFDAGDQPQEPVTFPTPGSFGPCTDDAGATTVTSAGGGAVTVKVVRDTTVTRLTVAHSAARKQATGTVRVTSHFGLRPAGSAAFTLRKGGHPVKTIRATLDRNGVASATFKGITQRGRYSIVGTYLGNAALAGSSAQDRFTVSG